MKVQHIRAGVAVAVATGALGAGAVALAQGGAPPKLTYAETTAGAPSGPATAQPGATTIVVTADNAKEHDWALLRVKPGVDVAAAQSKINKPISPDAIESLQKTDFDIVTGGEAYKNRASTQTVTLDAGTYLMVNTTSDKKAPSTVLTVGGDANGASAPAPAATVTMHDYKFTLNRSLPRTGVVKFVNAGKRNHMAIAMKVGSAKDQAKLVKALKSGDQKALRKLVRGGGTNEDVMGPGKSADLNVNYGKGRYVFACFWQSKASKNKPHIMLGMEKGFQVK